MLYSTLCLFKQKTAYEMRISDWSSDVCSSDLSPAIGEYSPDVDPTMSRTAAALVQRVVPAPAPERVTIPGGVDRSEENTSDLQSLMRTSYADFCLYKKNPALHNTSDNSGSHVYRPLTSRTDFTQLCVHI